jgi:hypothetical protein
VKGATDEPRLTVVKPEHFVPFSLCRVVRLDRLWWTQREPVDDERVVERRGDSAERIGRIKVDLRRDIRERRLLRGASRAGSNNQNAAEYCDRPDRAAKRSRDHRSQDKLFIQIVKI